MKPTSPQPLATEATVEPIRPELARGSDPQEPELPGLSDYLAVLLEHRLLVGLVTALFFAGGVLYALTATPVYRSDAVVQVEEKHRGAGTMDEIAGMLSMPTPAETEMEIIRSRWLLGAAADDLRLDVVAEPVYLPYVGAAFARRHKDDSLAPARFGLTGYAWGGERIHLARLDVPPRYEGKPLTLIARPDGYELRDEKEAVLAAGRVNQPANGAGVSIFVDELRAHPGTRFSVARLRRDDVVAGLKAGLKLREVGKQTGIIELSLEGTDATRTAAILDAVAKRYLRQNVERKSEEAAKTLEFLNGQIPQLKAKVEAAEEALNEYRQKSGAVDVSLETKAALDHAADIEKTISTLDLQRAELAQRFTDTHPALATLREKLARLKAERDAAGVQMKQLPASELELARLMRDVKVASELYVLILNKTQELNVVKWGTIGNVRIVDTAMVPRLPVSPQKTRIALLSLVMGLVAGVAGAFVRRSLHHGVEDPDEIERITGLPVHAAISHSPREEQLAREVRRERSGARPLLASDAPNDAAVEAIRSLRTSVEFALAESRNNVVTIGGPSQGIGKSFVAVNLAHVMADAGQRVLLVDADMRRGGVHRFFREQQGPGLADLIAGKGLHEDCIRKTSLENLHVLPMGRTPPNPSELLASQRFRQLVLELSAKYDVLVFDTPPILPVTDAALVARHAGVTLVVAKADEHHARELQETVRRYAQNGVRPYAVVLNDVRPKPGKYGYGYYRYEYRA